MANPKPVDPLDLPEILQIILSHLPVKDQIRASSLSRTWHEAVKASLTRSILEFGEHQFFGTVRELCRHNRGSTPEVVFNRFFNYFKRSLQRYEEQNTHIWTLKLDLCTRLDNAEKSIVDRWINLAVSNGLKDFQFLSCHPAELPTILFEAKSLEELSVCSYSTRLKLPERIRCHNLKSLHLRSLKFEESELERIVSSCHNLESLHLLSLDFEKSELERIISSCHNLKSLHLQWLHIEESELQRIISSCHLIEDLKLWHCSGISNLKVNNVPKLKQFSFNPSDKESVEVDVPNLESFTCYLNGYFLSWCTTQNLKRLVLLRLRLIDGHFDDFKFPSLEYLQMKDCSNLDRIRISCPLLREIDMRLHFGDVLEELKIEAPSMTQFYLMNNNTCAGVKKLQIVAPSMNKFRYYGDMISEVSFTSSSSNCSHICTGFRGTSGFVKLNKFLSSFSQSRIYLYLDVLPSEKDDTFDVRKAMAAPLLFAAPQVYRLMLNMHSPTLDSDLVFDGLFWACRPKTIFQVFLNNSWEELLLKKLMLIRNQDYQYSREIKSKSWEENLKEVRVQYDLLSEEGSVEPCTQDLETFLTTPGRRRTVIELEWKDSDSH